MDDNNQVPQFTVSPDQPVSFFDQVVLRFNQPCVRESPRDRLIREMSVAFIQTDEFASCAQYRNTYQISEIFNTLIGHADNLYPKE